MSRNAQRRALLERGLQELEEQERAAQREEPQQSAQPQEPQQNAQQEDPRQNQHPEQRQPGWIFDEATSDNGDDFGMSDGLTLAQHMYNLPPGKRFL